MNKPLLIAVIAVGMFASVADAKPRITGGNLPPLEKPRITGGNSPPILLPTKLPRMIECRSVDRLITKRC